MSAAMTASKARAHCHERRRYARRCSPRSTPSTPSRNSPSSITAPRAAGSQARTARARCTAFSAQAASILTLLHILLRAITPSSCPAMTLHPRRWSGFSMRWPRVETAGIGTIAAGGDQTQQGRSRRSKATSTCAAFSGSPARSATATKTSRFPLRSMATSPEQLEKIVMQSKARSAVYQHPHQRRSGLGRRQEDAGDLLARSAARPQPAAPDQLCQRDMTSSAGLTLSSSAAARLASP